MTNTSPAALAAFLIHVGAERYITVDEVAQPNLLAIAEHVVSLGLARRLAVVTPSIHEFALTHDGVVASIALERGIAAAV